MFGDKRMKKLFIIFLKIFVYVFVVLYALLTITAAGIDIYVNGFHVWHIFYFVGSALLILSLTPKASKYLLYFTLVLMICIAVINGFITKELDLSHIFIRVILSGLLSICWYYMKKSR